MLNVVTAGELWIFSPHPYFAYCHSGMFQMGEMHGPGTVTFRNRDRYEGMMSHNKMHGVFLGCPKPYKYPVNAAYASAKPLYV